MKSSFPGGRFKLHFASAEFCLQAFDAESKCIRTSRQHKCYVGVPLIFSELLWRKRWLYITARAEL